MTTPSAAPSASEKARLLRRAHAIARLRHPNLVRLITLPGGAGLTPVTGSARRLAEFTFPAGTFKRFELTQFLRLLLDVLSGLSALHDVSVDGVKLVHGDVSPEHIYIDEHGLARLVPLLSAHCMPGARPVSSGYTAPERLAGSSFDARADLFSVGVMLWEALAGRRLFPDSDARAVAAQVSQPAPLTLHGRAAWAQPLCAIAERAIALHPEQRFENAGELRRAIAEAARPQLARVENDDWQDEAPTPLLQPRLHFPPLRSTTPPATVVDTSTQSPERKGERDTELEPVSEDSGTEPSARRRRRPGAWLALAAASVVGIGWLWPRVPALRASVTQTIMATPLRIAAQAKPASLPALARTAPAASTASAPVAFTATSTRGFGAPSATPAIAPASASAASPAAPVAPANTQPRPLPRTRASGAAANKGAADYGI